MVLASMICRRFINNVWGNFMARSMPPKQKWGQNFFCPHSIASKYGAVPDLTST